MFDRIVTVFKKTKEGCEKQVIKGAFYDDIKGISLETKGEGEANSIKVVIPLTNVPESYEISDGDYLCKGEVVADYADITSMKQSEPTYLITACDKKDYGSSMHYLILGR